MTFQFDNKNLDNFIITTLVQMSESERENVDVERQNHHFQLGDQVEILNELKKQEKSPQLPIISSMPIIPQKQIINRVPLASHKPLEYLYHSFCKKIYTVGPTCTFDHIARSAQFMPINKWMIFCRQFGLENRLKKNMLLQIYRDSAGPKQDMSFQTFCLGLQTLTKKINMSENVLIRQVLSAETKQMARERLKRLKANFDPKINYFIQAQLTQRQKEEIKLVERKPRYVLHQGMSLEHIQKQIRERKKQRQEKRNSLMNNSSLKMSSSPKPTTIFRKVEKRRKTNYFESYSQIFQYRKQKQQQKNQAIENMKMKLAWAKQKRQPSRQHQLKIQFTQTQKTTERILQTEISEKQSEKPKQEKQEEQELRIQELVSETDSDEILKQHFQQEDKRRKKMM